MILNTYVTPESSKEALRDSPQEKGILFGIYRHEEVIFFPRNACFQPVNEILLSFI